MAALPVHLLHNLKSLLCIIIVAVSLSLASCGSGGTASGGVSNTTVGGTDSISSSPPVNSSFRSAVLGDGAAGISSNIYELVGAAGYFYIKIYFDPFLIFYNSPPRLTLPTRFILPIGKMNGCYACHRLNYAVPSANPQVTPITLPSTTEAAAESGKLTKLTDDAGMDINGMWSPDGKYIAWVSNKSGNYQIWIMDSDGKNKRQVTQGPALHGWQEWSPDGTRLVYWEHNETTGKSAIRTSKTDGSDTVTIVESGESVDRPVWRPDGKYLAYAAQTGGNWDIWVTSSDGKVTYRLTSGVEMETNPKWSPDGTRLAYKEAPIGDYPLTREAFMTFPNGFSSPALQTWNGPQSIQMSDWSPDGRLITYTAETVSSSSGDEKVTYLALIGDINGGSTIILSGKKTLGDRGPVFSPDGKRIAFWAWDLNYRATLWLVNTDGSNLRQLTYAGFDMYPRWSPDGKKLLFESSRGGNMDIWVISAE